MCHQTSFACARAKAMATPRLETAARSRPAAALPPARAQPRRAPLRAAAARCGDLGMSAGITCQSPLHLDKAPDAAVWQCRHLLISLLKSLRSSARESRSRRSRE